MANADGTAPTQAIDAAGAIATPGQVEIGIAIAGAPMGAGTAAVVASSLYQNFATALRVVMPCGWALTRTGVVSAITGATW
jgi:hypothetical protein